MPSTTDEPGSYQHGIFLLEKGEPNSGKSGAAYSFPNPFVFDFDRKMPTVANKHFPGKKIDWECWDDVFALHNFIKPWLLDPKDGNPNARECPYETLIVDSVTSLSTLVLQSLDKTKGTNVVQMMQNVYTSKTGEKSVEVMGIDYYNAETNFFERSFMSWMKTLWSREGNPKHVIVLAHKMRVESAPDLKTGAIRITDSILTAGRKAAVFIPSRFDDEYVFIKETQGAGSQLAKDHYFCITAGKENARCGYKFPREIDFTDKSLYDELNKVAKWS